MIVDLLKKLDIEIIIAYSFSSFKSFITITMKYGSFEFDLILCQVV